MVRRRTLLHLASVGLTTKAIKRIAEVLSLHSKPPHANTENTDHPSVVREYDQNENGQVDLNEVRAGINDFADGELNIGGVRTLINYWSNETVFPPENGSSPSGDREAIFEFSTDDEILSSPTISNGVIYIGSNDTNLYTIEDGGEREVGKLVVPAERVDEVLDSWTARDHPIMGESHARDISWHQLLKRLAVPKAVFEEQPIIDLTDGVPIEE